jgi:hypothetical protein
MSQYYVSTSGSSGNSGLSSLLPKQTYGQAMALVATGDTITGNGGNKFRETVTLSRPSLHLTAYGSGRPDINGANLVTSWSVSSGTTFKASLTTQPNNVFINGSRATKGGSSTSLGNQQWWWGSGLLYVRNDAGNPSSVGLTVEAAQRSYSIDTNSQNGFVLDGLQLSMSNSDESGLYVHWMASGFTINNCVITNHYGFGIHINGTSTSGLISNCTITFCGEAGIWQSHANNTNWTITGNTVTDCGWRSVSTPGFLSGMLLEMVGGSVTNNTVRRCGSGAFGYYEHGLYFGGVGESNTQVSGNVITDMPNGYGIKSRVGGVLHHNTVLRCVPGGIDFSGNATGNITPLLYKTVIAYCGTGSSSGGGLALDRETGTISIRAYNLTLYHNSSGVGGAQSEFAVFANLGGTINLRNNIVVASTGGKYVQIAAQSGAITSDYNIFFGVSDGTNPFVYAGTHYNYAGWKALASGRDTHSITSDPLFTNAGASDFSLQAGSPAINAGVAISGITDGFHGIAPDMGAIESGGGGVGGTPISGSGTSTLGGVHQTGTATRSINITGSGTSTLGGVKSTGSSSIGGNITGSGTSTLGGVASSGSSSSATPITGSGTSTLAGVGSSGGSVAAITGSGTSTLAGVSSSGQSATAGLDAPPAQTGVASQPSDPVSGALLYRGFELRVEEPAWIQDADASVDRRVTHVANPIGRMREMAESTLERSNFILGWHMDEREEIDRFMDFLYRRRGMMEPVWLPSWKHDLWLLRDALDTDALITIEACGYTERMFPHESRRHLILIDQQLNYVIRRVISATNNGDGTESLLLEAPLGLAFKLRQTEICFLLLARQSSDDVEMVQHGIDFYMANVGFTEVPEDLRLEPYKLHTFCDKDTFPCGIDSLADRGWTLSGTVGDANWNLNGHDHTGDLSCSATWGISRFSAPDTSSNFYESSSTKIFSGFPPNARVYIELFVSVLIVVADTANITITGNTNAATASFLTSNYPGWRRIFFTDTADDSGNVSLTMETDGTRVLGVSPPEGVLLEWTAHFDDLSICTAMLGLVSEPPVVSTDIAWVDGYPKSVGDASAAFAWTAPEGAVEIAIETSDTIGGTYTAMYIFTDGAHVPNGSVTNTGSFPRGTTKYARVRALINGNYFYSTEEPVEWGSSLEVAPVITDLFVTGDGFATPQFTHVEWTLAGTGATSVTVNAQRIIFSGISPTLVATITDPSQMAAGSFDIPGRMVIVRIDAVYLDGTIQGTPTSVP